VFARVVFEANSANGDMKNKNWGGSSSDLQRFLAQRDFASSDWANERGQFSDLEKSDNDQQEELLVGTHRMFPDVYTFLCELFHLLANASDSISRVRAARGIDVF
jgi:hypothetical protein